MSAPGLVAAGLAGWHYDGRIGVSTRQPVPKLAPGVTFERLLALPDWDLRRSVAVHEAAHAVVLLALGVPVEAVVLSDLDQDGPAGYVQSGGGHRAAVADLLVMSAAGERAQDRWLRENRLWTPARAWAVEVLALHDRRQIADSVHAEYGVELTFGVTSDPVRDLDALHRHTDCVMDRLWPQVLSVASALHRLGSLTESQLVEAASALYRVGGVR